MVGKTHPRARLGHSAAVPQPPGCLARAQFLRLVECQVSAQTQSVTWQRLPGQVPCKTQNRLRALQTEEAVMQQRGSPGSQTCRTVCSLKNCRASSRHNPCDDKVCQIPTPAIDTLRQCFEAVRICCSKFEPACGKQMLEYCPGHRTSL